MCGRYALYGPVSRLREAFDAAPEGFEFEPRWNAAPMQWCRWCASGRTASG